MSPQQAILDAGTPWGQVWHSVCCLPGALGHKLAVLRVSAAPVSTALTEFVFLCLVSGSVAGDSRGIYVSCELNDPYCSPWPWRC